MDREPVGSSAIAAIGYSMSFRIEEAVKTMSLPGTLEIEFGDGSVYQYVGVPMSTYQAMVDAPSIGGYFNEQIRSAYRGWRVR